MISALTRNLGHRISACEWLIGQASAGALSDVLFLQEVLPNRIDRLNETYEVFLRPTVPELPRGRHSVLAFRKSLDLDVVEDLETFGALGTYASCARTALGGREVVLASIHASPSQLLPEDPRCADVATRSCEAAPWWADVLVAHMSAHVGPPLVIAGDFNEARAWDARNPRHRCSAEFFSEIDRAGFTDVTFRDWHGSERPTRRDPDYQLDHVIASRAIAGQVRADDVELVHDGLSDHASVTFSLAE
jgi:endonuclease/exonuclease/phosphatase family metal-dependent hydrolase